MKTSWTNAQRVPFEHWPAPVVPAELSARDTSIRDQVQERDLLEGLALRETRLLCVLLPQPFLTPAAPWAAAGTRSLMPAWHLRLAGYQRLRWEQLTGAPDEPAHPPGGPQQDLKPSHEEDGADTAHQLVVPLLLGSLELAVCFLRFLCALFGKWVEAPGPLGLLLPPAVVGVPWLLPWGGRCGHRPVIRGVVGTAEGACAAGGRGWGSPLGVLSHLPWGAWESSTPTGDWQGNEEANPKHCIVVRELFSSVCFSLQEKTGFFWESDSCFVTSDITTALLFAVWFVLQVKSSRQRFSSVLGSSQKYAFISPQKYA